MKSLSISLEASPSATGPGPVARKPRHTVNRVQNSAADVAR